MIKLKKILGCLILISIPLVILFDLAILLTEGFKPEVLMWAIPTVIYSAFTLGHANNWIHGRPWGKSERQQLTEALAKTHDVELDYEHKK